MGLKNIMVGLGIMFGAMQSQAQPISQAEMANEGFGDIGALYGSMTPEQQQDVRSQAAVNMRELEQMSPEERAELLAQMHAINNTLKVDLVDPAKLDTKKTKSPSSTQKDFMTYQTKYRNGQIKNAVVK